LSRPVNRISPVPAAIAPLARAGACALMDVRCALSALNSLRDGTVWRVMRVELDVTGTASLPHELVDPSFASCRSA